jgi:rhombotail lipoprotein
MKLLPTRTLALFSLLTACGGARMEGAAPTAPLSPPAANILTTSVFAKDSSGALTEGDLQKVLSSPIDLELPARVGVVPLDEPFDPRGPVSISMRTVAASDLASSLVGAPYFSQVSDISTDLPNVGGLEGLRVIAARYRVRYLLLLSTRFEDASHANGWAWLYPTVVGLFAAPGITVQSQGIAQADLLDVRTGTLLFTVVEPMSVSSQEWLFGSGRPHREEQQAAAAKAAKALARKVVAQTNALVAFADAGGQSRKLRVLPPPIAGAAQN